MFAVRYQIPDTLLTGPLTVVSVGDFAYFAERPSGCRCPTATDGFRRVAVIPVDAGGGLRPAMTGPLRRTPKADFGATELPRQRALAAFAGS